MSDATARQAGGPPAGKLEEQWLEIFRAGDYGDKGRYSEADLDEIVANYDLAQHEAPVVVGHPEHDSPAYGWVEKLKRAGAVLMARLRQVAPEFEQAVREGRFKKRSIALYSQPKLALRHIGFLGAMAPQVKGLADAHFSDQRFQSIEFDDPQPAESANEGGHAELKAAIEEAVAAALKPLQEQIQRFAGQAGEPKPGGGAPVFSEAASAAISGLKAAGRWIPAFDRMGVPQLFSELAKSDARITFGEGDKRSEKTAVELFADFLGGLPQMVPSREIAGAAATARRGGKLVQFTEPRNPRTAIDAASVEMAEAAQQRANDKKVSFGEALRQLRSEGWKASGSAANAV